MTITWTPPLIAPTVTATAVAGGTIPNGTYYIRVTARHNNNYWIGAGTKITAGNPSIERTVVLSGGNGSINITYPAITGAIGYNIYITTLSPSTTNRWVNKRMKSVGEVAPAYNSTNLTNVTYTDTNLFGGYLMDLFAIDTNQRIEGGLTRDTGTGYLTISGTGGTISLETLYQAMVSAGATDYCFYDGNYFVLKGALIIDASTTGSMTLNKNHLIFIAQSFRNNSSSFTLTLNDCVVDIDLNSDTLDTRMTVARCCFKVSANPVVTNYRVGNVAVSIGSTTTDGGYNFFGNGVIVNACNPSAPLLNPIIVFNAGMAGSAGSIAGSIQNGTLLDRLGFSYVNSVNNSAVVRGGTWYSNFQSYTTPVYDNCIILNYACTLPYKLIDLSMPYQLSNRRPLVNWQAVTSYNNLINIYFSYLATIVDANSLPVQSVGILLKNSTGAEIINTSTNSLGTFSATDVLCTKVSHKANSGMGMGFPYTDFLDYSPFTLAVRRYGKVFQTVLKDFNSATKEGITVATNNYVSANEATALAYTGIAIDGVNQNITLTQSHTIQEVYDYAQAWACISGNLKYDEPIVTSDGSNYTSTFNLIINGCNFGGTGNETLVGHTLTILNNGTYSINITDTNGTYTLIKLTNLVVNSRVQLYDATNSVELYNEISSSSTLEFPIMWATDRVIRVRVMYVNGTYAKKWVETTGTLTKAGMSLNVTQEDDTIYNSIGVDGSTVTECEIVGTNLIINITDADNTTTAQRLYAFEVAWLYTVGGIRDQKLYIDATDMTHFIFEGGLKIKNINSTPLEITGANIVPVSGMSTDVLDTTGGSIFLNFNRVEGFAYMTQGGLTTDQVTKLNAIPTNPLLTTDSRLDNLDSKVSSIPINPLLESSYIAPDNTGIADIKTKVDTLNNTDLDGVILTQSLTDKKVDEVQIKLTELTS